MPFFTKKNEKILAISHCKCACWCSNVRTLNHKIAISSLFAGKVRKMNVLDSDRINIWLDRKSPISEKVNREERVENWSTISIISEVFGIDG